MEARRDVDEHLLGCEPDHRGVRDLNMGNATSDYGANTGDAARDQMDRKHTFVVNGDPAFLDLMREVLQDEQFNVTTTNYVPRTFEVIQALGPDLLIIDLSPRQESGPALITSLQRSAVTNEIPMIVVSTSRVLLETAERLTPASHQVRYILKPLDLDDLMSNVNELIGVA